MFWLALVIIRRFAITRLAHQYNIQNSLPTNCIKGKHNQFHVTQLYFYHKFYIKQLYF
jgi:hypothetical protein